jgi:flagellar biogenesis protein FliO
MVTSIALLSLGLIASPITISEVTSVREGGRLVVDIAGDAMVDPEAASARVGSGELFLYVEGTRVRANNRAWGEGKEQIRAHRHSKKIELVIPLGEDGGCRGPVEFEKAAGGLRATLGCQAATTATPETAAPRPAGKLRREPAVALVSVAAGAVAPAVPAAPRPVAVEVAPALAIVAANPGKVQREADQLRAMLALADPPAKEEHGPAGPQPAALAAEAQKPPALVAIDIDSKPKTEAAKPQAAQPEAARPEAAKAAAPVAAAAAADKPASSGGGGGVILAVMLLIGLAGSAYYFARRRGTVTRFINIVETANLGPKRSLIVARIGDETMILGASEAGITLLKAHTETRAEVAAATAPTTAATGDPVADAWFETPAEPIPEADFDEVPMMPIQGGLLARLFKRAKPANESDAGTQSFEDLLDDSIEDQELRHKLSIGMAGRVA